MYVTTSLFATLSMCLDCINVSLAVSGHPRNSCTYTIILYQVQILNLGDGWVGWHTHTHTHTHTHKKRWKAKSLICFFVCFPVQCLEECFSKPWTAKQQKQISALFVSFLLLLLLVVFRRLTVVYVSFCSLVKGIAPKI